MTVFFEVKAENTAQTLTTVQGNGRSIAATYDLSVLQFLGAAWLSGRGARIEGELIPIFAALKNVMLCCPSCFNTFHFLPAQREEFNTSDNWNLGFSARTDAFVKNPFISHFKR